MTPSDPADIVESADEPTWREDADACWTRLGYPGLPTSVFVDGYLNGRWAGRASHPSPLGAEGAWVLVPREPTREMWAAMGNAVVGYKQRHHDKVSEAVWKGALAARPSPPASAIPAGEASYAVAWHRICQTIATIMGLPEPEADFAAVVRDALAAPPDEDALVAKIDAVLRWAWEAADDNEDREWVGEAHIALSALSHHSLPSEEEVARAILKAWNEAVIPARSQSETWHHIAARAILGLMGGRR
jgi:hypothetical protein